LVLTSLSIFTNTKVLGQFTQLATPTNEDLTAVFFLDRSTGFTGGTNGVLLKTNNGGKNWTHININNDNQINGIYFLSEDTGFIVGNNNIMLKTINGGKDWLDINPELQANYTAINFISPKTGIIIGHCMQGGIFMKTINGGETWDYKLISANDNTMLANEGNTKDIYLTNFSFYNENAGLLGGFTYDYNIGKFPFICKTEDGGKSFTDISPEVSKNDWYIGREIVSINYMNANDACAIVNSGLGSEFLLISDYNVASFEKNNNTSNFKSRGRFFSSLFLGRFIGYFTGIIDGESCVLKTIDQGASYMFLKIPNDKSLYATYFTDIKNGFFVGQDGTVLHLSDENNIVYNMAENKFGSYFDPPFTIANTRDNMKKSFIHVYNVDLDKNKKVHVDLFDSFGNEVDVKRLKVRTYSDEIRIKIMTDELQSFTYFYTVKFGKNAIVNGKIDLGSYAEK